MSILSISGSPWNSSDGIPLAITTADQVIDGSFGSDQIVVQIPGGTAIYYGNFSYTGSRIDDTSSISGYTYSTELLSLSLQFDAPLDMATYFSLAANPQNFARYVLPDLGAVSRSEIISLDSTPLVLASDALSAANVLTMPGGTASLVDPDAFMAPPPGVRLNPPVSVINAEETLTSSGNLHLTAGGVIVGTGSSGNDHLSLSSGTVSPADAKDGPDTVSFNGLLRQYALTGNPSVRATISGPASSEALSGTHTLTFLDGSLTFDPHAHIAQIGRLYQTALGRSPDPLGLNFHTDRLDGGSSLSEIAGDFVNSPEFQSVYGQLSDSAFVATLYLNVLGRPAEAEGLAYWSGRLAAGASRGEIVTGFSESRENIENHAATYAAGLWDMDETAASVARLYIGILNRPPYLEDLLHWTQAIKSRETTLLEAATSLLDAPEFKSLYQWFTSTQNPIGKPGSISTPYSPSPQVSYGNQDENTLFIDLLYLQALGRPADNEGEAYWSGLLKQGVSKASVLLGFTESPEFQERSIAWLQDGSVAIRRVTGTEGDDILSDSPLIDHFFGYAGADQFLFKTPLSPFGNEPFSSSLMLNSIDKVIDFTSGSDKILLDHSVFSALPTGELAASSFVNEPSSISSPYPMNTVAAHDESDHILYKPTSGDLFYDPDGNGPEPAHLIAQFIAQFIGHTPLTAADFLIV